MFVKPLSFKQPHPNSGTDKVLLETSIKSNHPFLILLLLNWLELKVTASGLRLSKTRWLWPCMANPIAKSQEQIVHWPLTTDLNQTLASTYIWYTPSWFYYKGPQLILHIKCFIDSVATAAIAVLSYKILWTSFERARMPLQTYRYIYIYTSNTVRCASCGQPKTDCTVAHIYIYACSSQQKHKPQLDWTGKYIYIFALKGPIRSIIYRNGL